MAQLNTFASLDSFTFPSEQLLYFYTTGQACKREHKHNSTEPAVSLIMHTDVEPYNLEKPTHSLSTPDLMLSVALALTELQLRWSERADYLVNWKKYETIVLVTP